MVFGHVQRKRQIETVRARGLNDDLYRLRSTATTAMQPLDQFLMPSRGVSESLLPAAVFHRLKANIEVVFAYVAASEEHFVVHRITGLHHGKKAASLFVCVIATCNAADSGFPSRPGPAHIADTGSALLHLKVLTLTGVQQLTSNTPQHKGQAGRGTDTRNRLASAEIAFGASC